MTVRFVDGEELEGKADRVTLDGGGFTLVGTGGNTRSLWVGPGAIKYVSIHPARRRAAPDVDPREGSPLPRLVLRFLDGEVLRTYQDEAFKVEPGGFAVRLWQPGRGLVKALVAGSALKGIFEVEEWDSRSEEERRRHAAPTAGAGGEASPPDSPPALETTPGAAPVEPQWVEQDSLLDMGPELESSDEPTEVPAWVASVAQVQEPEVSVPEAVAQTPEPELITDLPALNATVPANDHPHLNIVLRGDTEERRATFNSGLLRRRALVQLLSPEEERHLMLRARISEVLGSMGPEPEAEEQPPG